MIEPFECYLLSRRDLDQVSGNEVDALQATDNGPKLTGAPAAGLGSSSGRPV